jgi:hypothetical protein
VCVCVCVRACPTTPQELFVCGRIKDLVIVRGRNFFPQVSVCVCGSLTNPLCSVVKPAQAPIHLHVPMLMSPTSSSTHAGHREGSRARGAGAKTRKWHVLLHKHTHTHTSPGNPPSALTLTSSCVCLRVLGGGSRLQGCSAVFPLSNNEGQAEAIVLIAEVRR